MKLSRRGKHTKHARRARHTKRAGKHLRYKGKSKKFRASKRYHRGNKRTYKRGKRFHRGGVDILGEDKLPEFIREFIRKQRNTPPGTSNQFAAYRKEVPLTFDYIRTDGIYSIPKKLDTRIFDVVIVVDHHERDKDKNKKIYLLRHDKSNINYDKRLYIPQPTSPIPILPIIGIFSTKPQDDDSFPTASDGTYTFPRTDNNILNFQELINFVRET